MLQVEYAPHTESNINKIEAVQRRTARFVTGDYRRTSNVSSLLEHRGLTGGFLLLQNFSVAISVSPHVCFILVLILISMFLR